MTDTEVRRSHDRFPHIDGMRAVAAVLVLVVHSAFNSGFTLRSSLGVYTARGEVGVAVFFLISGFLLYRPFALAHLGVGHAPSLRTFGVRRALRIVPLYWFALTVVGLATSWRHYTGTPGLLASYLFAQVYRRDWALQGISQAWTLDIEVLFYLSLPLWSAMLGRGGRPPRAQLRRELMALGLLWTTGWLYRVFGLTHRTGATERWNGWLPAWVDMFALGMALAVLSAWVRAGGTRPAVLARRGADVACWLAAAAVYVAFSRGIGMSRDPLTVNSTWTEVRAHALYGLFALLLVLPAAFPAGGGPVRAALSWRPVAFLGLVSYGIYLWHQFVVEMLLEHTAWKTFSVPILQFLPAVLAGAVLLSALTYRLVEAPAITLGHRLTRRPARERPSLEPA